MRPADADAALADVRLHHHRPAPAGARDAVDRGPQAAPSGSPGGTANHGITHSGGSSRRIVALRLADDAAVLDAGIGGAEQRRRAMAQRQPQRSTGRPAAGTATPARTPRRASGRAARRVGRGRAPSPARRSSAARSRRGSPSRSSPASPIRGWLRAAPARAGPKRLVAITTSGTHAATARNIQKMKRHGRVPTMPEAT